MNIKEDFLTHITQELSLKGNQDKFFWARFAFDNSDLSHKECYKEAGIDSVDRTDLKAKIIGKYQTEMEQDKIDCTSLENKERGGGRNDFQVIFDWLWHHKYFRWIEEKGLDNWLEKLKQEALENSHWLKFIEYPEEQKEQVSNCHKDFVFSEQKATYEEIEAEKDYKITVNIPQEKGNLVLLYWDEKDVMRIFYPSTYFGKKNQLSGSEIKIPEGEETPIQLQKGLDQFIGIWMTESLTLKQLNTNESAPKLNANYIDIIFSKLAKSENYQIFHRFCHIL